MDNVIPLTNYYGLDYVNMLMVLLSIYLLGTRRSIGFITGAIAGIAGAVFGYLVDSPPVLAANVIFVGFNIWSYYKWEVSE